MLFPGVFLPLHIFEERYRAMTRDALAGDRIIGMTLLRPGFEGDYEGRPPIYPVGCAGVISHSERLPTAATTSCCTASRSSGSRGADGGEYRRARVEPLTESRRSPDERATLERLAAADRDGAAVGALKATEVQIPGSLSDEDLVHALCQYLQFEPAERQALLECEAASSRAHALTELLEMQALLARHPGGGAPGVH